MLIVRRSSPQQLILIPILLQENGAVYEQIACAQELQENSQALFQELAWKQVQFFPVIQFQEMPYTECYQERC